MAHQIEQMAYVGQTPLHGLGNNLPRKQPMEVWQREAGMDRQILESPVHFKSETAGHLGAIHSFPEQKALFRSDTKAPLSVVFQRYHTVQPREVLELYHDLTGVSGYELEVAGDLKGGHRAIQRQLVESTPSILPPRSVPRDLLQRPLRPLDQPDSADREDHQHGSQRIKIVRSQHHSLTIDQAREKCCRTRWRYSGAHCRRSDFMSCIRVNDGNQFGSACLRHVLPIGLGQGRSKRH